MRVKICLNSWRFSLHDTDLLCFVVFQYVYSRGTYLLLEKCKTVCYRNLFKRIHTILDKHQISLNYVARALKYLGMAIDLDEVECILANLIFRGYIRGYLSHAKRVLVLSKRDPFPMSAVVAVSARSWYWTHQVSNKNSTRAKKMTAAPEVVSNTRKNVAGLHID